jgi:hypothetical protein
MGAMAGDHVIVVYGGRRWRGAIEMVHFGTEVVSGTNTVNLRAERFSPNANPGHLVARLNGIARSSAARSVSPQTAVLDRADFADANMREHCVTGDLMHFLSNLEKSTNLRNLECRPITCDDPPSEAYRSASIAPTLGGVPY